MPTAQNSSPFALALSCSTLRRRRRRLAVLAGMLGTSAPLFACSDSPPVNCAASGMCTPTEAGDAQSPDRAVADAASADDVADAAATLIADAQSTIDAESEASEPIDAGDALEAATACDPTRDPKDEPCLVSSTYGVFVSTSGSPSGAGTPMDPVATITAGVSLAAASGKPRVFICGGQYAEQVSLGPAEDGIGVYGGFNCLAGWTWSGAPTTVAAPPAALAAAATDAGAAPTTGSASSTLAALRIASTTLPIAIEDLAFSAPDAIGQDGGGAGRSSLAAFVSSAFAVRLARVTLSAGRGADGAPGAMGAAIPNYDPSKPTAPAGVPTSDLYDPGTGGMATCSDSSLSIGGAGGALDGVILGVSLEGQAGASSPLPSSLVAPLDGAGGTNQSAGDPGADGRARPAGVANPAPGSLSATGWQPSAGTGGLSGDPGQGGGGGAGGVYECNPSSGCWNAYTAGAGGGAGGCGGAGGHGGAGGGASLGLVSVASAVSLSACTITTSAAGAGGAGGAGQPGQGGGAGGADPISFSGGPGGNGAGGSGGAGGRGGISVGIASTQILPTIDSLTTITLGTAGAPGPGGPGGAHGIGVLPSGSDGLLGARGLPGLSAQTLAL